MAPGSATEDSQAVRKSSPRTQNSCKDFIDRDLVRARLAGGAHVSIFTFIKRGEERDMLFQFTLITW